MYASNLKRVGSATRQRVTRSDLLPRRLQSTAAPPPLQTRTGSRGFSSDGNSVTSNAASGAESAWRTARSKLAGWARVPSASSIAGAVALVPVAGGAWLVTVYALRQRLCEHHLQQVEGAGVTSSKEQRRRRSRSVLGGRVQTAPPPLCPGSSADARGLREMLQLPARGVTVLCVDPPATYTGDAFLRSALLGRAATVHIRAGEGDGSLAACLARGLGVQFMSTKLQMSALLPGLGERDWMGARGRGGELSDIGAILQTATAALEEIKDQADDPRHHLPPVIVIDGLLGRVRAGEQVPPSVEAVLRWCWTISGGRRLAHVVLTAPQSMAVDGSLDRVKTFLNAGRPSPGMMRAVALDAPDRKITERRFRARFTPQPQPAGAESERGEDEAGERAVALCMELVHGDGCGVSEEANVVLRQTGSADDSSGSLSASRLAALDGALEGIALEAWRRTAAAVSATTSHSSDGAGQALSLATGTGARGGSDTAAVPWRETSEESARQSEGGRSTPSDGGGEGGVGPRDELAPGFLVDDYASLEAAEHLSLADSGGVGGGGSKLAAPPAEGVSSAGFGDVSNVAALPTTPLGRLMRLLGELADGGKVSVAHAVSILNGDGKALGRLFDLGVLRLCPQTVASSVGDSGVDTAEGVMYPLSMTPQEGVSAMASADVLAEAVGGFQVAAATPIIGGVFAILRGYRGVEEQAIARAMHVLRGANPGGFLTELAHRQEWQAHREASMTGLVHGALWRGRGGSYAGEAEQGPALSSRRLQTALAAVGCAVTRSEIEAANTQLEKSPTTLALELIKASHRATHAARAARTSSADSRATAKGGQTNGEPSIARNDGSEGVPGRTDEGSVGPDAGDSVAANSEEPHEHARSEAAAVPSSSEELDAVRVEIESFNDSMDTSVGETSRDSVQATPPDPPDPVERDSAFERKGAAGASGHDARKADSTPTGAGRLDGGEHNADGAEDGMVAVGRSVRDSGSANAGGLEETEKQSPADAGATEDTGGANVQQGSLNMESHQKETEAAVPDTAPSVFEDPGDPIEDDSSSSSRAVEATARRPPSTMPTGSTPETSGHTPIAGSNVTVQAGDADAVSNASPNSRDRPAGGESGVIEGPVASAEASAKVNEEPGPGVGTEGEKSGGGDQDDGVDRDAGERSGSPPGKKTTEKSTWSWILRTWPGGGKNE